MGTTDTKSPFGAYALPPGRELVRSTADRAPDTRLGRWGVSYRRKRAIRGLAEPFDIAIAPYVNARLYPFTNRCEKRALCGVQVWDAEERAVLREAVEARAAEAFVFLDVGANVGLYSLFASAYAREAGRPSRIIAVEPSKDMGARLRFNAHASGALIEHVAVAISDTPGTASLSSGGSNRGEGQLSDEGEPVEVITLLQVCERHAVTRIHAMKLDIEGHDERALEAFFRDAPESLHPDLLIVELTDANRSRLVELCTSQNYLLRETTSLNGIFEKSS